MSKLNLGAMERITSNRWFKLVLLVALVLSALASGTGSAAARAASTGAGYASMTTCIDRAMTCRWNGRFYQTRNTVNNQWQTLGYIKLSGRTQAYFYYRANLQTRYHAIAQYIGDKPNYIYMYIKDYDYADPVLVRANRSTLQIDGWDDANQQWDYEYGGIYVSYTYSAKVFMQCMKTPRSCS